MLSRLHRCIAIPHAPFSEAYEYQYHFLERSLQRLCQPPRVAADAVH